jgi:hypothetical protein
MGVGMIANEARAIRQEEWRSDHGGLTILYPADHVLVFKYLGHMSADVVPFVENAVDRVLAVDVRPDIFVDLAEMTGYDSAYRIEITQWGGRIRNRVNEFSLLTRSTLIAMGVSLSNLALGGFMSATTRRSEFDTKIDRAVRRGPTPARRR